MTSHRPASITPAQSGGLDAEFTLKLDLWGAYFRVFVALPGLVIALTVLPEQRGLGLMLALYVSMGALVPVMLRSPSFAPRMRFVRPLLAVLDVALVSSLSYGWGTQVSPATYMYVTIVVGWTLVPQRGIGLFALLATLASLLVILLLEGAGLVPIAPLGLPGTSQTRAPGGPVLFFALLGSGLTAVHLFVVFVGRKLSEHVLAVVTLRAEKEAREREIAWALELEETQRLEALGRLAGGIAHDFNNLLTALIGFAEIAQRKLYAEPRMADGALKELNHAAERAANLTGQLLDFASRRATQPRALDLRGEVERSVQLLSRVLRADIALHVVLCDEPCVCNVDPSGLERVLVNLGVNARDAMPLGGTLHIELVRDEATECAVLRVSDSGTGIDEADLPRIFEPFFTTKARGRGAGLGLASVYGVVKQSGGEIDVSSRVGEGTTFTVRLPLLSTGASVPEVMPLARGLGAGTVLLVDDQPEVRAVIRAHLESVGYVVLEAESGEQALTLSVASEFNVLVSDVAMPGMSGLVLAHTLRTRWPGLPVLLISGYSDADIAPHEALPRGARFLSKPFTAERLARELSLAIGLDQVRA